MEYGTYKISNSRKMFIGGLNWETTDRKLRRNHYSTDHYSLTVADADTY